MNISSMSLIKQLMLLLVGSVFISQLIVLYVFSLKSAERIEHFRDQKMKDLIMVAYDSIENNASLENTNLLPSHTRSDLHYEINDHSLPKLNSQEGRSWRGFELDQFKGYYKQGESGFHNAISFWFSDRWRECQDALPLDEIKENCAYSQYEFPLPDGKWLLITANSEPSFAMILMPVIFSALFSLIIISYSVFILVRKITSPLHELNQAAKRFGRGEKNCLIKEIGSKEFQETISAFNAMQQRIARFVDDRTKMLAAVSHDLRTPITSLRLRAEFVPDETLRGKMIRTLEDMEQMVESCLTFTRQDSVDEAISQVDLVELLSELADDSSHLSFWSGVHSYLYPCQRVSLTRALVNLIDNAVKYGKQADIRFQEQGDNLLISIEDYGDGIPEHKFKDVFEPFVRLDESRNTAGASVGLGLSITRTIIHKHGGTITLSNTNQGLKAEVILPVT